MTCITARQTVAILAAVCVAPALPAAAETGTSSSWVQRTVPQKPPRRSPITSTRRKSVPRLRSTLTPGTSTSRKPPLGKTMVVPSGDNAAYIAFDQGQYLTAFKLAGERAKQNDPQAHTLIGRLYAEGLGVPKDQLEAAKWYRRGAELGDVEAMFAFGVILASGTSVKKDHAGAGQMFEQAAAKGHAYAHYNLALLFLSGKGKPENPHRAALHLEFAGRKGIAEAQYDLAALYRKGHGVNADAYKAALWLRRAADKGLPSAQFEYAVALLRGKGINSDRPKLMDYLKSAAEKGIAGAQHRLGYIYSVGIPGVSKDPVAATKWWLIARANGIKDKSVDATIAKYPRDVRTRAAAAAEDFRNRKFVGQAAALPQ